VAVISRSWVVGHLAAMILLAVELCFAAPADEKVYAITDVMVTDNASRVPGDYTGVSPESVTLPYILGQEGERVSGADVNRGIGGTTTSIWVKYKRLPNGSAEPVLVDIEVCHWPGWKVALPEGPGWKVANGTSAGIPGALTTKTKGSAWRNGLAVRYMPLRDAGSRIMALYLSVTSSGTPSQLPISWPPSAGDAGKAAVVLPAGVDIHRGGGGKFFFLMKCAVSGTPTRDPLADGITVLTYNTHLFGGSPAETVGSPVKEAYRRIIGEQPIYKRSDPVVFDESGRTRGIADRIRKCGADIVALQEVWTGDRQSWFCNELKDVYAYRYHVPQTENSLDLGKGGFKNTCGLVLLSKYRLTDLKFSPFPTRKLGPSDEDAFARKGVITATVELWPGGPTFRVGVSHASTDMTAEKQPDIKQIANVTTTTNGRVLDSPAIMMGDFNINWTKPAAYQAMKGTFEQMGAVDAYRKVHPPVDGEISKNDYTANVWNNLLYQYFSPDKKVEKRRPPEILDYMFVKESGGGLRLTPVEAEVFRDWRYAVNLGWWQDLWAGKWDSSYVAVVSFQLKGQPYLFGLKNNNTAYISQIDNDGRGWHDISQGKWASNYVDTAITTFNLKGHPHIFALKRWPSNTAYISRINDDGKGWKDIYEGKWASNYVAVVSFQLNGHPYLFGLKANNTAYISQINNNGKGWKDIYQGKWSSHYVGSAITTFYLNGHPHIFALKKNNTAYISRINDDGKGWKDIYQGKWASNYIAVRSFEFNGHAYLFGLKTNNTAYISQINDDGRGWTDIYQGEWSSKYVGSAITTFDLEVENSNGNRVTLPHMFSLKGGPQNTMSAVPYDQGWITRFGDYTNTVMDLSDHYPIQIKFKVSRTASSER
jgi:endonuclease/exonuclease/phosphatase family metal-dependent hydrolase